MKVIYEILDEGIQEGSKPFFFYFPVTIAPFTYVHHKLEIPIADSSSFSVPKGIILVRIKHSRRILEIYLFVETIYLNSATEMSEIVESSLDFKNH